MTAKEKVAHRKLSMLQLAEKLRNVSEACKIMGYSRQQFYEIKRSFQEHGFDGLLDKPTVPGSVPTKTPPKLEKKVIDMSIEHRPGASSASPMNSPWKTFSWRRSR
ncbi:hypothetical protein BMS3Abin01_00789 [bacterium BMS3Abin01]|nr:hypothetical protein BMS3Abin01_00789 [bacterium BMS3Abin01]